MGATRQPHQTVMVVALALVIGAAEETTAMPITVSAEHVAIAAQQLRDDATVEAALRAVRVGVRGDRHGGEGGEKAPAAAEQALAALGFETALDLQLLAGGPEAVELMDELRTGGELSIADRAKIRLLVGDREHLARVLTAPTSHMQEESEDGRIQYEQGVPRPHRQLQDQSNDSLSADTIAIVFSVFVGVCGYLLQAWTADRAQRHAADLQREHDQKARELRVEHERAQAQVRRTERWVDDCCTPIGRAMGEYITSRWRFVPALTVKLEATQPEAFVEMYKEYSMKNLDVKPDGAIYALGKPHFDSNIDMKGLTWGAPTIATSFFMGGSPAAVDVAVADFLTLTLKFPYVRELPQAFLDVMAADLTGPLAEDYRGYIRHEIKPVLDRIKEILHAHFAAIEMPLLEWLIETFPGHNKTDTPNQIVDSMVIYARGWDRVLAEWDAGQLEVLYPPHHLMPWLGVYKLNAWSRERGEAKQHDLIGMSSGRKDGSSKVLADIGHAT